MYYYSATINSKWNHFIFLVRTVKIIREGLIVLRYVQIDCPNHPEQKLSPQGMSIKTIAFIDLVSKGL